MMLECLTVKPGLCSALAELPVELQPLPGGGNKQLQGQPEAAAVCSVDRQSKGKVKVILDISWVEAGGTHLFYHIGETCCSFLYL